MSVLQLYKCTVLVGNGRLFLCKGINGKFLHISLNFSVNLKLPKFLILKDKKREREKDCWYVTGFTYKAEEDLRSERN
jgi:hypothetical protein